MVPYKQIYRRCIRFDSVWRIHLPKPWLSLSGLCDTTTACRRLREATAYHLDVLDGIYLEELGLRVCGGRNGLTVHPFRLRVADSPTQTLVIFEQSL